MMYTAAYIADITCNHITTKLADTYWKF